MWTTGDIWNIEAYGDVGTPYGEIHTVYHRDDYGTMWGNDQDADIRYDSSIGEMILGLPADVSTNEPVLNIMAHTAGTTYTAEPATPETAAVHPTLLLWDSGATDFIGLFNDDTHSVILSEVAGGANVNLQIFRGDATGDQAKIEISGYDETAAAEGLYTFGTHDDGNNLLSLQIGLLATTAATRNLVVCDAGGTPALNAAPLNSIAHAKLSIWDSGATDCLIAWDDDTYSHLVTNANPLYVEPTGGLLRIQDFADGDNTDYLEIYVVDAGGRVVIDAEPSGLFRLQDAGDSNDSEYLDIDITDASTEVLLSTPGNTLVIQGRANAIPGDVHFFDNQTDPGSAIDGAIAAGEVPELVIYGWDHADTALNTVILRMLAVEEGITPTDDEHAYFNIHLDSTSSRGILITDDSSATPELTAALSHPTLRIYDSGNTDALQLFDDDTNSYLQTLANPLYLEPTGGIVRIQDYADADDSEMFVITVDDTQGFVLLEAEPSGLFRFQDVGDADSSDMFQIEVTDGTGYTKFRDESGVFRFDDIDDADASDILQITVADGNGRVLIEAEPSGLFRMQDLGDADDSEYLDIDIIDASGEVLLNTPGNTVVIQGATSTTPGDVEFFSNQSDPGTDIAAAGEVPEIRIYGWDHADTALNQVILRVVSVEEGVDPTDDEMSYFNIAIDQSSSRYMILTDDSSAIPELTVAASHPTFRIYDSGNTDYLQMYDDDSQAYIQTVNTLYLEPTTGVIRIQDLDDADDSEYLEITTIDAAGEVVMQTPGSTTLVIQGLAATEVGTVEFFDSQTDPGTGIQTAGNVPHIRIYGWDHASTSLVYNEICTRSVVGGQGVNPDDNEANYLFLGVNTGGSQAVVIGQINDDIQIAQPVPDASPNLRLYDQSAADFMTLIDDGTTAFIKTNTNPIGIAPSGDADDYVEFTTNTSVPGFHSAGGSALDIQNTAAALVYDVTFFANQTDPGSAAGGNIAAGEAPEIRIYGWDHADSALRYMQLRMMSVAEGTTPDDNEMAWFQMGIHADSSRIVAITDAGENIEIIAAQNNPTLRIYDNGGTDYIELYDDDSQSIIHSVNAIDIKPNDATDDHIRFQTVGTTPGFVSVGACDLDIQNGGWTALYDVTFFANQTVPAATPAAGSTPELRVYGWSSATINTQVYSSIKTSALEEGTAETTDELAVMRISPANNILVLQEIGDNIEFTAATTNPTLQIYDAGGTDSLKLYDDDTNSYVESDTNPIWLLTKAGTIRLRDLDDTDNTNYLEFSPVTDAAYTSIAGAGGNTSQTQIGYFYWNSTTNMAGISAPMTILCHTGIAAGTEWADGNYTGGLCNRGFATVNNATDSMLITIPVPELGIDTNTATEFTIELRIDPTNATDRFDYAVYDANAGTELEARTDYAPFTGANLQWITLLDDAGGQGQGDHLTKGDALVVAITGVETNAPADVNMYFYALRITYKVGIENNAA